jgi:hypothetical protein
MMEMKEEVIAETSTRSLSLMSFFREGDRIGFELFTFISSYSGRYVGHGR